MRNENDGFRPIINLGQALRKYRLQSGLTQKSVSDALGITRSAYTYYETGKTSPDPTTLFLIARMFDVPLDLFFDQAEFAKGTELTVREPDEPRKRVSKKVRPNPQNIGELTSDEKCMIAFLRSRALDVGDALERLKDWYDNGGY